MSKASRARHLRGIAERQARQGRAALAAVMSAPLPKLTPDERYAEANMTVDAMLDAVRTEVLLGHSPADTWLYVANSLDFLTVHAPDGLALVLSCALLRLDADKNRSQPAAADEKNGDT